jgi:glucans biosynthesis protein
MWSFRIINNIFSRQRIETGMTLILCFFTFALALTPAAFAQQNFTFKQVVAKAQQLVQEPYNAKAGLVPDFLLNIKYDAWRDIRFRPAKSLWHNENLLFTAQFFHPGMYFPRAITINVVDPSGVKPVPFSTDLFMYEKSAAPLRKKVPSQLGFAGFRLHYPINTPDYCDEVIVFLGASYFRAVAQNSNYGLSARGISINSVSPVPEEFPHFKEYWLVKPVPGDKQITLYALLDGESVTGAYQFIVQPGKETLVDVKSTIFLRKKVERLGIAPMTSMFFYGENTNTRPANDFRPEIHDSDGLQIALRSGEWLWRPLKNPAATTNNWFSTTNPTGFGLINRDLDFDHYQDLEARYEKRPSIWISPKGSWGEGWVVLLQLPSRLEFDDNMNALWVPAHPAEPKQPMSFDYTMTWHYPGAGRPPAGQVVATRTADGKTKFSQKYVIDFAGGDLESIPGDKHLTAVVSVDPRAKLVEQQLEKNIITKGWRLVFEISLENEALMQKVLQGTEPAIELRAFLKDSEKVLTETWSYALQP